MFKKRNIKKKPLRHSSREDDDDHDRTTCSTSDKEVKLEDMDKNKVNQLQGDANQDNNNDTTTSSLLQVLEETKRKRKLLTDLQFKRGTDATKLMKSVQEPSIEKSKKQGEQLTTEATTKITCTSASQATVLEQKHQQAMEEFIMKQQQAVAEGESATTQDETATGAATAPVLSSQELYQQLASEARSLQGSGGGGNLKSSSNGGGDADKGGSSDAVMLHGTGIAEVILPIQERAEQASELVQAVEAAKRNRNNRKQQHSSLNHPLPVAPSKSSSVPNRFMMPPRIVPHTTHTEGGGGRPHGSVAHHQSTLAAAAGIGGATSITSVSSSGAADDDDNRPGFAALRQRPVHEHKRKMAPPSARASDDQVFKKFVAHQREQSLNKR